MGVCQQGIGIFYMYKTKNIFRKLILLAVMVVMAVGLMNPISSAAKSVVWGLKIYSYDDRAAINWHTDGQYESELKYGKIIDEYKYKYTVRETGLADWHSYELQGLVPETKYYYKIVLTNKDGETYEQTGEFETTGNREGTQNFERMFFLSFDNGFYSKNNQYPLVLQNEKEMDLSNNGVAGKGLSITDKSSFVEYSNYNTMSQNYGTAIVWFKLDDFGKDQLIWQTDDSGFALYYDRSGSTKQIVARVGENEDGEYQEAKYVFNTIGTGNVWQAGEWHFIAMSWEGRKNGWLRLYIDGTLKDKVWYENVDYPATFRVGSNYRGDMLSENSVIDEFKLYNWVIDETWMRHEYASYGWFNQERDVPAGKVAGYAVRYFKLGKLLKGTDNKVWVIARNLFGSLVKVYISDLDALKRFGNKQIISAYEDELKQYADGGTFTSWSKFPHGTLLKATNSSAVYYLGGDGKLHLIPNENVFYKYNNEWQDVVVVSQGEIDTYRVGENSF